jgi:ribonuclease HI
MSEQVVIAFTDGACRGNPGPGGWGALMEYKGRNLQICGGEELTTNNRMELMAAIQALEHLTQPCLVRVVTDSVYVSKGISEWLPKWIRNGWKTASKEPVKNHDLWERLMHAKSTHSVEWQWVKGHAGHPGNERADLLANQGIDNILKHARVIS